MCPEIIFQSTHSADNEEDHEALEVGVGTAFSVMGFDVDFKLNTEYGKSDISRSIENEKEVSIRPNPDDPVANDLCAELQKIRYGTCTNALCRL